MNYTREQQNSAYKKLSDEARYFVMSNETTDAISAAIQENQFSEEQADQADSEILYAMYGLQTLDDAVKNIASLSQKPVESLASLKSKLKENVFDKLEEIKKNSPPQNDAPAATTTNLPMVEEGEVAHEVPHEEIQPTTDNRQPTTSSAAQPAEQLKQADSKPVEPPTSRYPDGKDPYREPLD